MFWQSFLSTQTELKRFYCGYMYGEINRFIVTTKKIFYQTHNMVRFLYSPAKHRKCWVSEKRKNKNFGEKSKTGTQVVAIWISLCGETDPVCFGGTWSSGRQQVNNLNNNQNRLQTGHVWSLYNSSWSFPNITASFHHALQRRNGCSPPAPSTPHRRQNPAGKPHRTQTRAA